MGAISTPSCSARSVAAEELASRFGDKVAVPEALGVRRASPGRGGSGPGAPVIVPGRAEDRVPAILEAAEIVLARLGHEKLSLVEIAKVSLIPLARIYQYFGDRNAVLGALSTRHLAGLSFRVESRDSVHGEQYWPRQLSRLVGRLANVMEDPSAAFLVLCGPFDEASMQARMEAIYRLSLALRRALQQDDSMVGGYWTGEALDYAAEIVFACFRRSYLTEGRISGTAIEMAEHGVLSFVGGDFPGE